MKKNLCIVDSPFHLLTAFIMHKSILSQDENYLALIHPQGFDEWKNMIILAYMHSLDAGWKDVFPLIRWMTAKYTEIPFSKQVEEVKNSIGALGIDEVYLGNDLDEQNQFLVSALGKSHFYRYEDGMYSYYNKDRRRSLLGQLCKKLKMRRFMLAAGLIPSFSLNAAAIGDHKACIGEYFYKPSLLRRNFSPAHEITSEMIQAALEDLRGKGLLEAEEKKQSILFLSQPMVEKNKIELSRELEILRYILENLPGNISLLYKPHPGDRREKIAYYKENLPAMRVFNSFHPIELSFACEENFQAIISYQSTALLTVDKFSVTPLKKMSLSAFYSDRLDSVYVDIMRASGVRFPKTLKEIMNILFPA